jgi:hypothetical protein
VLRHSLCALPLLQIEQPDLGIARPRDKGIAARVHSHTQDPRLVPCMSAPNMLDQRASCCELNVVSLVLSAGRHLCSCPPILTITLLT